MSNNLFASVFAVALSLASAASFATPTGVDVRDQVLPVKAQAEEGRTRYWSHPRLGMVKVDAASRLAQPRLTLGAPPFLLDNHRPAHLEELG